MNKTLWIKLLGVIALLSLSFLLWSRAAAPAAFKSGDYKGGTVTIRSLPAQ